MSNRKVSRYFDKSTSLVRDAFTQFEQQYAQPAYSNMQVYFRERPVICTFVTIFTLLSLAPVAFFAGIASFISVSFIITALFLAVAASFVVVLGCSVFLAGALIGTFLISLFLTGAALSSYAVIRLALHVQREGPSAGVSEWRKETKHAFLSARPTSQETASQSEKKPVSTITAKDQRETEYEEHLPDSLYDGDDRSDMTLRKEDEEDEENDENVKGKANIYAHEIGKHEDGEIRRGYQ